MALVALLKKIAERFMNVPDIVVLVILESNISLAFMKLKNAKEFVMFAPYIEVPFMMLPNMMLSNIVVLKEELWLSVQKKDEVLVMFPP